MLGAEGGENSGAALKPCHHGVSTGLFPRVRSTQRPVRDELKHPPPPPPSLTSMAPAERRSSKHSAERLKEGVAAADDLAAKHRLHRQPAAAAHGTDRRPSLDRQNLQTHRLLRWGVDIDER